MIKTESILVTYDQDFYAWTQQQSELLRTRQLSQIDWYQIAEEIEDMGRSEKRELESRLEILLMYLLKWQFQPNLRSRSWQLTIKEQRLRLAQHLQENLSLKSILPDSLDKIYQLAIISAERETGLSVFPESCPYPISDVFSLEFLPDESYPS